MFYMKFKLSSDFRRRIFMFYINKKIGYFFHIKKFLLFEIAVIVTEVASCFKKSKLETDDRRLIREIR